MWVENPEVLVPHAVRNADAASNGDGNASKIAAIAGVEIRTQVRRDWRPRLDLSDRMPYISQVHVFLVAQWESL